MHSRSIVGFVRSVSSDRLNGVSVIGRQLPPGGGSNRSDVAGWPKELSVPTSFHRSAGELGLKHSQGSIRKVFWMVKQTEDHKRNLDTYLLSSYPGQMSRRTEWSHVKAQIPSKRAFHPRRAAGDARRLRHSSFGRRENSTLWLQPAPIRRVQAASVCRMKKTDGEELTDWKTMVRT
jgi:hypothetical protein